MGNNFDKILRDKIQTWFVTGASSGIGRELCVQLSQKGYNVVAVARTKPLFDCKNVLSLSVDVTKIEEVVSAVGQGIEKFGRVDVLVNCAGLSTYGTFEEETVETVRQVMETNYWGCFNTIKVLLPSFRENSNGTIVNISSEMGLYPRAYGTAYCSSKYALEGLSSVLWCEASKFCRILTVEMDKFDGTNIGKGRPKGVSNIEQYQKLPWLAQKSLSLSDYSNDLSVAVNFIILEVEKKNMARRLMLGKSICQRANEEIISIKNDLKNSLLKAYACAGFDVEKEMKNYFKYWFLSKFYNGKKSIFYKEIHAVLKYIKENFR